jgi:hypothetical protein
VIVGQSKVYYAVLEQFTKLLEVRKQQHKDKSDFQRISNSIQSDQLLLQTLDYLTDYMRKIIESGIEFNTNHFWLALLHLELEQLTPDLD